MIIYVLSHSFHYPSSFCAFVSFASVASRVLCVSLMETAEVSDNLGRGGAQKTIKKGQKTRIYCPGHYIPPFPSKNPEKRSKTAVIQRKSAKKTGGHPCPSKPTDNRPKPTDNHRKTTDPTEKRPIITEKRPIMTDNHPSDPDSHRSDPDSDRPTTIPPRPTPIRHRPDRPDTPGKHEKTEKTRKNTKKAQK